VAVVSLASLVAVVLAGLNERRRELAVLRAVGAGPRHVLLLLAAEGVLVTLAGALLGAVRRLLAVLGGRALGAAALRHHCWAARPRRPNGGCWAPCWPRVCLPAWCPAGAPTACRWPTACPQNMSPTPAALSSLPCMLVAAAAAAAGRVRAQAPGVPHHGAAAGKAPPAGARRASAHHPGKSWCPPTGTRSRTSRT
jgi:hypothetical protein